MKSNFDRFLYFEIQKMSWFTDTLQSSIGKKLLMALTGLFLIVFLITHLAGNLQLLNGADAKLDFNAYALFMTTFPPIKAVSYLLYASILGHAFYGLMLTLQNKKARPVAYAVSKPDANSAWSSRNMGVLGTMILIFLVIHMKSFWYEMHWGTLELDSNGNKDLHAVTVAAFSQAWYVILYVVSMIALGFHLVHGFSSAFQSMGWNHPKYTPLVKSIGFGIAVIIPALFALIPIVMLLQNK
jgi:succinate dehydrogenase / fumarate reductase, cytochrome b subunit